MDIPRFKKLPIMAILRGIEAGSIEPLFEAILQAGLNAIEITMNTPGAASIIKKAVRAAGSNASIGAGTVLSLKDMYSALDAGATFIVSPCLIKDVASYCLKNSIPIFPGALTPEEVYIASESGAAMVKVFPAKCFGPAYFKELKGPYNNIDLLACGGVTAENIKSYLNSGASAAAFGSSIFKKEWLGQGDFKSISARITRLIRAISG